MSVNDKILPPEILFKILPVAAPILGFFVLAPTAAPIYRCSKIYCWFKNYSMLFSVPLNIFLSFVFILPPSNIDIDLV